MSIGQFTKNAANAADMEAHLGRNLRGRCAGTTKFQDRPVLRRTELQQVRPQLVGDCDFARSRQRRSRKTIEFDDSRLFAVRGGLVLSNAIDEPIARGPD